MKLRVLDLFSGIGGFSLGLERTGGFETVAFCEIEPFCRRVLAKHWPHVRQYHDVRTLTADALSRDGITVDVICGGFPCQDVSESGPKVGLDGEKSGLWSEYSLVLAAVMLTRPASAHDAIPTAAKPQGWSYPFSCCSGYDCREVSASSIEERPEGYVIAGTGEVVGYTDRRIKDSPDGLFHWCSVAGANDGKTICLFVPPRSY